jgi:hypothetical protein
VERYLAHLDRISGGIEPRFIPIDSSRPGQKGITAIVYEDVPEPGHLTGLTYGLSLSEHPEWRHGKPELLISVDSSDDLWALAVADVAENLRGRAAFSYGETINFGEPISPESEMSAFVVFAPAVLDREDFLDIDVGDELPVHIAGVYPIHQQERLWILEHGLEAFWKSDWDRYDVRRAPAVG